MHWYEGKDWKKDGFNNVVAGKKRYHLRLDRVESFHYSKGGKVIHVKMITGNEFELFNDGEFEKYLWEMQRGTQAAKGV